MNRMVSISMLDKIKQQISILRNKKITILLLLYIFLINFFILIIGGIASYLLSGGYYSHIFEAIWDCFKCIIEPGFLVETANYWVKYLSALMIIIGMIMFTGATVGYITNIFNNIIDKARSNQGKLFLKDHIIILNWNIHALDIITEYFINDRKDHVIVLSHLPSEDVINEIENKIFEEKLHHIKGKLNWFVREGDVSSLNDLNKIYYQASKSIIILSDINDPKGLNAIKTLMLLSKEVKNKTIIIEIKNQQLINLVNKIKSQDKYNHIIAIPIEKLLGKLIGQIVINPYLSPVYNELLTYKGAEIYTTPRNKRKSILELMTYHKKAVPIDIVGDNIYWLAERKKDINVKRKICHYKDILFKKCILPINKKRILILGDSLKLRHIFETLNAYSNEIDENIFNITHSHGISHHIQNINLSHLTFQKNIYNTSDIYQQLNENLTIDEVYESILILSHETNDDYSCDTNALLYLLHIDYLLSKEQLQNTSIIIELLNSKHNQIAYRYNKNSVVIISNKYIAKLLAQISNNQSSYRFFEDVLNYKGQDDEGDSGKEIYIVNCKELIEDIPLKTTKATLIYNIKKQFDYILLGIISNKQVNQPLFKNNLDKEIVLTESSLLILYAQTINHK